MAKGITRERIVAAALDLLDAEGVEAVTVRAVSARLDVRAPALYWHVRGKQELLDEMGTEIQRRVNAVMATVEPAAWWGDDLAAYARILRAEYLRHRDGARSFSGTRITDAEVVRALEPWLARWTAAGVRLADVVDGIDLVTAFVVGFVIEEQEKRQSDEAGAERYSLADRDAWLGGDVPLVKAAGRVRGDSARFERQLAVLLAGVSDPAR
jgi:AcrR family transcriptional regulator